MRKVTISLIVLFMVIGQGFLFADRKAVDDFIKSYEEVVVEAEQLAKKETIDMMDMMPLQMKAMTFADKAQAVQNDPTFRPQDSQKILALTERYNDALETITDKL